MSSPFYSINSGPLSIEQLGKILSEKQRLQLSGESRKKVHDCRAYLENKLNNAQELFYGINTGFGSLCNIRISESDIALLQNKLVQSHACGTGELVPPKIIRLVLLLKIQSLSLIHI